MTTLAPSTDYTGAAVTQGGKKTFISTLRTFIADLFGSDSGQLRAVHEALRNNGPGLILNLKLVPSVAGNALTMTVRTRADAAPSAADPVLVSLRNAAAGTGDSLLRQVSAAQSLVISSGSTLGHTSGVAGTIYWYQVDSDGAGVMKLAATSTYYGPQLIGTTVAEGGAGAADSATLIYSNAVYANVAMRLVGRSTDTQAAAGTWVTLPSAVDLWPFDAPATTSIVGAAVRQTVSGGPADSNGFPNLAGATGGTTVTTSNITATAPLAATAAAGFDPATGKALDYFGFSTANLSWTSLSTNGTMYLYVDVNTSTGALTTGSTTLAPNYQWGGTYSITNLQNTYNIQEGVMKVGNGSTAAAVNRVFVGEVTVAGAVVTAITWYAYLRRYVSARVPVPAASTRTAFNHRLGIPPEFIRFRSYIRFLASWNGYTDGMVVPTTTYYSNASPPTLHPDVVESATVAAHLNNLNGMQITTSRTAPTTYTPLPTGSGTAELFAVAESIF